MPRTAIPVTTLSRSGVAPPTQTAADTANGNSVASNNGRLWVEVENTDSSSHTVTFGIPGDIDGVGVANGGKQVTLTAGQIKLYGNFPASLYNQTDGLIYVDCSSALVKYRAYLLP